MNRVAHYSGATNFEPANRASTELLDFCAILLSLAFLLNQTLLLLETRVHLFLFLFFFVLFLHNRSTR